MLINSGQEEKLDFDDLPLGRIQAAFGYRARRGQLRASILVLLNEQPRNGYQLMGTIAARTASAWKPSPGALYPALAQLVEEGLITESKSEHGRVYQLTETGTIEAGKQPEQPWDDAAVRGRFGREERFALWREFRLLGAALHLAHASATPAQLAEITRSLKAQRRTVHRLLGEGHSL